MPSPLDEAREYLARVLVWPQDETVSFGNMHWTFVPKDYDPSKKLPWTGRAARTLDEAFKAVVWASKSADTRDIYACMSSQRIAQEAVTAKGWKYYKPVRLAENAVNLKALWIDIDGYKDSATGYPTMQAASAALAKFVKDASLPKPSMIVGSGGGMHVYWLTNQPMTVEEWYPLASALKEAIAQHGLRCDPLSTDAARVLRVPGTTNHKWQRPVRILARTDFDYQYAKLDKALAPYKVEGSLPEHLKGFAPQLPRKVPVKGDDDLTAGIQIGLSQQEIAMCLDSIPNPGQDWIFWNTIGMRVWAACEGADYGLIEWQRWSDTVNTEGKDTCEDRWATLNTSPPTRTGAGALINAARDALGDQTWLPRFFITPTSAPTSAAASAPGVTTPTGSSTTSGNSASLQAGSPASGAIAGGSPSAPASVLTPLASVDPCLPHGYSRDTSGIIWQNGLDDDGKPLRIKISDYPMTDAWLQNPPYILHFKTKVERGKQTEVHLPLEIVNTNEMRKHLQSQGFMLNVQPRLAQEFFLSWIKTLQETKDAVVSAPFGWTTNRRGFIYGGQEFSGGTKKPAAHGDPIIARRYKPTGDLQAWLDAAELITSQGRSGLDAILASAFAAPLVMFTGHRGMHLSTWSQQTGIGKSTAMAVAQAVWGHPVKAMSGLDDTQNSVMGKIGEIRHLPMFWDEIKTEEDQKKFVKIVFSMTRGNEKSRMTQSAHQRESGDWQTLLISASNDSILDHIVQHTSTTTAGLARVLEYQISPGVKGQIDTSVATRLVGKLDTNYGQVGLAYAEWLGNNAAKVDKQIGAFLPQLNTQLGATQGERFWGTLVGVLLLGGKYANDLGYTKIDLKAMKSFLFDAFKGMRLHCSEQPVDMKVGLNVSNMLAQFLNATRARHTLKTNRIHIGQGKPRAGTIKVIDPHLAQRLDAIYVHEGVDDKLLRISSTYLSEWLAEKGYSRPIFTKALTDEFGAKRVHGRIASGTEYAGATEYLIEISLAGSQLLQEQ